MHHIHTKWGVLYLVASVRQVDGGWREIYLSNPVAARAAAEEIRRDRATIDGLGADAILDIESSGRRVWFEWPGRTLRDIPFEEANDVQGIRYRLHPLDVGFDVRTSGHTVEIVVEEGPLRVSYPNEDGERRVMEGPRAAVIARLRELGFSVCEVKA